VFWLEGGRRRSGPFWALQSPTELAFPLGRLKQAKNISLFIDKLCGIEFVTADAMFL
jgi:hypothetical protein